MPESTQPSIQDLLKQNTAILAQLQRQNDMITDLYKRIPPPQPATPTATQIKSANLMRQATGKTPSLCPCGTWWLTKTARDKYLKNGNCKSKDSAARFTPTDPTPTKPTSATKPATDTPLPFVEPTPKSKRKVQPQQQRPVKYVTTPIYNDSPSKPRDTEANYTYERYCRPTFEQYSYERDLPEERQDMDLIRAYEEYDEYRQAEDRGELANGVPEGGSTRNPILLNDSGDDEQQQEQSSDDDDDSAHSDNSNDDQGDHSVNQPDDDHQADYYDDGCYDNDNSYYSDGGCNDYSDGGNNDYDSD